MTKHFSFTYRDGDEANAPEFPTETSITVNHSFDDNSTWDVVLEQFLKFLGHAWGYDISDQVRFETVKEKLDRLRQGRGFDPDIEYDEPEGFTLK